MLRSMTLFTSSTCTCTFDNSSTLDECSKRSERYNPSFLNLLCSSPSRESRAKCSNCSSNDALNSVSNLKAILCEYSGLHIATKRHSRPVSKWMVPASRSTTVNLSYSVSLSEVKSRLNFASKSAADSFRVLTLVCHATGTRSLRRATPRNLTFIVLNFEAAAIFRTKRFFLHTAFLRSTLSTPKLEIDRRRQRLYSRMWLCPWHLRRLGSRPPRLFADRPAEPYSSAGMINIFRKNSGHSGIKDGSESLIPTNQRA
mmetsp:Transcript_1081/g.3091  ORF Transcript_1081/g.3091 Transcript_1081/m.3091 type:complete len:257 (-) Transcript_1081:1225-1995(-)